MTEGAKALIAEAHNPDFRHEMQHLRSWKQIDDLLIALADRLAAVEKLAEEWSKPNHLGKYGYLAAQRLRSVLDGSGTEA
jgi:hypothetical protein